MHSLSITSEQFGQLLWTASWQAAVLAGIVTLVCMLLRRQIKPAWQFALWSLVFVRLACPVLPASMFSVQNLFAAAEIKNSASPNLPTVPDTFVSDGMREQRSAPRWSAEDFADNQSEFEPATELAVSTPQPPTTKATSRIEFSFWPAVLVLWGSIASLLMIRHLILWRRLVRLSSQWQKITDQEALRVLEDCSRSVGLRRIPGLFLSDQRVGPALLGVWKPRIVIPADVLSGVSPEELRMLLLHELQHIRRWDVLWDRLATLLVIVHWFNPAAWLARLRLRDTREQACDAAVLKLIGDEHTNPYGKLVMRLSEQPEEQQPAAVLVGMLGRSRSLSRRIEGIAVFSAACWYRSGLDGHTLRGGIDECSISETGTN